MAVSSIFTRAVASPKTSGEFAVQIRDLSGFKLVIKFPATNIGSRKVLIPTNGCKYVFMFEDFDQGLAGRLV